jgi:hypothetical protein
MSSARARNVAAMRLALDDHNAKCLVPARAILMHPEDFDRFGLSTLWGLSVEVDTRVRRGFFRIACTGSAWGIEGELEAYLRVARTAPDVQLLDSA